MLDQIEQILIYTYTVARKVSETFAIAWMCALIAYKMWSSCTVKVFQ